MIGRLVLVVRLAARKILVKPRESALSARMAIWVIVVSILARLTSLPRAQRIASARIRSTAAQPSETPTQLAGAIDSLLRLDVFVFRPSCWKRALVLHRFLALNGIESRINFGLQRNGDGGMRGHAWLEYQGRPFLENEPGNYIVTFSLPLEPSAANPAAESAWP